MAEFSITTTGLDEIVALFENAPGVIEDETHKTVQMSLDVFQQAVQLETPKFDGHLQASITTEIDGTPVDLTGTVSTPLIYGKPVEDGRAAGRMPPVEAIELWVIRKGLQWSYTDKRGNTREMTTHQMAYVIARAIGHGTTRFQKAGGAKMFQKGFDNALPLVEAEWDRLWDRVLDRLV